ncbi:MAG: glutamyl-tRNA reductase [Planctomycetota bacterium]
MEITVAGVNHRTASVEARERLALSDEHVGRLLRTVRAEDICEEAVLLSTCNRTEIYFVPHRGDDPLEHILAHLAELKDLDPPVDPSLLYRHEGLSAVSHLFTVAASLDSQIVGEDEILGQVKQAYKLAVEARTARFLMNKLFHRAFRVGKRVRTETELNRGSSSVPQAAVELAGQLFSSLKGKSVLLVGAGEMARLAAKALVRCGTDSLIVANRTVGRAEELAAELEEGMSTRPETGRPGCARRGKRPETCPVLQRLNPDAGAGEPHAEQPQERARAVGLREVPSLVEEVELVVCSTGAEDYVLRYRELSERLRRVPHPILMVDIAVPRDVDPRLGELNNIYVYNIDHLDRLVSENLERRRREIPVARALVRNEVQRFEEWLESLEVVPTIKGLKHRFDALGRETVEQFGKYFDEADRENLEKFAQSLCKKILHQPVAYLRSTSNGEATTDDLAAVDLIRRIFDLDTAEAGR